MTSISMYWVISFIFWDVTLLDFQAQYYADYPNCQLTESLQPRNTPAKQTSLLDFFKREVFENVNL
jgi:hypothetical protein